MIGYYIEHIDLDLPFPIKELCAGCFEKKHSRDASSKIATWLQISKYGIPKNSTWNTWNWFLKTLDFDIFLPHLKTTRVWHIFTRSLRIPTFLLPTKKHTHPQRIASRSCKKLIGPEPSVQRKCGKAHSATWRPGGWDWIGWFLNIIYYSIFIGFYNIL